MKKIISSALTILRFPIGIAVFFALYNNSSAISTMMFFSSGLVTDVADGFLARRWGTMSSFGKKLDTVADGFFLSIVWLGIAGKNIIFLSLWLVGFYLMLFISLTGRKGLFFTYKRPISRVIMVLTVIMFLARVFF